MSCPAVEVIVACQQAYGVTDADDEIRSLFSGDTIGWTASDTAYAEQLIKDALTDLFRLARSNNIEPCNLAVATLREMEVMV